MSKVFVLIPGYLNSSKENRNASLENISPKSTNDSDRHKNIRERNSKVNISSSAKKYSSCVQCSICKKIYANIANVKRHMKNFHAVDSPIVKINNFVCQLCNRQFRSHLWYKFHLQKAHPDADASKLPLMFASTDNLRYSCSVCNDRFSSLNRLKCHRIKQHQFTSSPKNRCPLCHELFLQKDILKHFETVHDITLERTQLEFLSFSAFITWKENTEIETKSKFIIQNKPHSTYATNRICYFKCNRSGNFRSEGQGKRNLKAKGSIKINAYCPASIKLKEMKNGRCVVTYLKTHVGHEADLKYLPLSYSERQYLATKIAAKVPFEEILNEVHNAVPKSGLQRLHLITRKDLHNIKSSFFKFKNSRMHKSNSNAVDDFVKKLENDHLCLLPKETNKSDQTSSVSPNNSKDLSELPDDSTGNLCELLNKQNYSNQESSVFSTALKKNKKSCVSKGPQNLNADFYVLPNMLNDSYSDSSVFIEKPNGHVISRNLNDSSKDMCMLLKEQNESNENVHALVEKSVQSDKDPKFTVQNLEKKKITLSLNEEKENLKKQFSELLQFVSTSEELDYFASSLISLKKKVHALQT